MVFDPNRQDVIVLSQKLYNLNRSWLFLSYESQLFPLLSQPAPIETKKTIFTALSSLSDSLLISIRFYLHARSNFSLLL